MTEIPGGLAIVRITLLTDPWAGFAVVAGPTAYRMQKATVNEKGRKQDVTSTSTTGIIPGGATRVAAVFGDGLVSVVEADVTLVQASYDPSLNLFGAPVVITTGSHIYVEIFPDVAVAASKWDFPHIQVESVDHEIDATALQPITLKGFTRGGFTRPV